MPVSKPIFRIYVGQQSYIINPKRITDNIRMISPVLLSVHPAVAGLMKESTKNRGGSDLFRRAQVDTL